jgi:hypothetical protein
VLSEHPLPLCALDRCLRGRPGTSQGAMLQAALLLALLSSSDGLYERRYVPSLSMFLSRPLRRLLTTATPHTCPYSSQATHHVQWAFVARGEWAPDVGTEALQQGLIQ